MSKSGLYVETDEMTLLDYLVVVRRRKWYVIIPTVLIVAIATFLSVTQETQYRASADVLVTQPATASSVGAADRVMSQRTLNNELLRAQGSELQDAVEAIVGTEPTLETRLASQRDVDVFIFTATSSNAVLAAEAANTYADKYIEERRASLVLELDTRITVVQAQIDELTAEFVDADELETVALLEQRGRYKFELEQLEVSADLADSSSATVIDAATVPESPFAPRPLRSALLGLVVGVLVGLGAAFLRDYMDNSLYDEEGLEKSSGLPVLAVIPKIAGWREKDGPRIITREDPTSPTAENYRGLRTALDFLSIDQASRVLQVTSPKPGDGKTTTAANLAVAFAIAGQKVVLLDCDLRRPRVHKFFDLPNDNGFTTVLLKGSREGYKHTIDGVDNLSVIPSGPIPPNPSELLTSSAPKKLISWLSEQFDLVIIDSPPVLVVSDPLIISGYVDGVLLVAAAESTDVRQVAKASELMTQVEAPLLGAVLNGFDTKKGETYQYRYSQGNYGPDK